MRQKTLDGLPIAVGAQMRLLVGPNQELAARQLTVSVQATQTSNANVYAGFVQPLVEPLIPANRWYLFSDPMAAPVYVYGYLNGAEGPQVTTGNVQGVDGVEVSRDLRLRRRRHRLARRLVQPGHLIPAPPIHREPMQRAPLGRLLRFWRPHPHAQLRAAGRQPGARRPLCGRRHLRPGRPGRRAVRRRRRRWRAERRHRMPDPGRLRHHQGAGAGHHRRRARSSGTTPTGASPPPPPAISRSASPRLAALAADTTVRAVLLRVPASGT